MSFWDNVKKFAQPYSDDEFDDYEEDDYMEDYEEPVVERTASRRRRPAAPVAPVEEEDMAFTGFAAAPAPAPAPAAPAAPVASSGFSGHVVNTAHTGKQQEVILFRPVSFNDASKVATDLRNRKAVVVNLENVDKALARRVVDFLTGCAFSMDGSVTKIAQAAYLFCPSHLAVIGDLESLQSEVESYI